MLPGTDTRVPAEVILALARQLDVAPPDPGPYWLLGRPAALAPRRPDPRAPWPPRLRGRRRGALPTDALALRGSCWTGDDRPGLLFDRATAWLLGAKALLPGPTTAERLRARIRSRVQVRRWEALASAFTPEQRLRLDGPFEADDAFSLEALRQPPQRFGPTELMRHLERLDAIRVLGLAPETAPAVPEAVTLRLARGARRMRGAALARLPEPRRTATLAALFHALEGIALDVVSRGCASASDDALDLFDQLVEQSVRDAKRRYDAGRLRSMRDLDAAALLAARAAGVVVAEAASEVDHAAARAELLGEISTEAIREATLRIGRPAASPGRPPLRGTLRPLAAPRPAVRPAPRARAVRRGGSDRGVGPSPSARRSPSWRGGAPGRA